MRISLRGCPEFAVVVRWESMVRGGAIFCVRGVVYDLAASCAKWHVERQRNGGARGLPRLQALWLETDFGSKVLEGR